MAEWETSQALWMWIASMGQAFRRLEPPSATGSKKLSSSIVFFDFDLTLTVVHVFKSLAGWVDAQVCMLAMRGIVVSEPHALTERGQLRRLAELGPAWIEQAFGGFSRVAAIRKLLDGLLSSGCRIILVTRGYVGVARKCLAEVGFLTAGQSACVAASRLLLFCEPGCRRLTGLLRSALWKHRRSVRCSDSLRPRNRGQWQWSLRGSRSIVELVGQMAGR